MRSLALILLLAGAAQADTTVRVRGGVITMRLKGHSEKGFALKSKGHSWLLEVTGAGTAEVELVDVTRGAAPGKWTVLLSRDRAELDDQRFIPGHAYRMQVRKGLRDVQTALVYLSPPESSRRSQVQFEEAEVTASGDEISHVPKNAL